MRQGERRCEMSTRLETTKTAAELQSRIDDIANLAREGLDVARSLAKIALVAMESKENYPSQDMLADVFNAIWTITERQGDCVRQEVMNAGRVYDDEAETRRGEAFYGNFQSLAVGRRKP